MTDEMGDKYKPTAEGDVESAEKNGKRCTGAKCRCWLKQNWTLIAMIVAAAVGVGMGVGLRSKQPPWTEREIMYLEFPGLLMLRMLKMLILPLIVSSLVSGVSGLGGKASGRLGGFAVAYYLTTTIIAVIIGIILVIAIKPGSDDRGLVSTKASEPVNAVDSLLDLIRNVFPDNLVTATFQQVKTRLKKEDTDPVTTTVPSTTDLLTTIVENISTTEKPFVPGTDEGYYPVVGIKGGTNILGIIVFSLALGLAIARLGDKGRVVGGFFQEFNEAIMKLVGVVIMYCPIGVLFLIASKIVSMKNPEILLKQLGMYMVTVIAGLGIHGLIVLPILYVIFVRRNPFTYILNVSQALVTALATASSSATLPITIRCIEEKNHIDPRVSRFVLPIGATINMDGTALYEAVAALFIAQINGITLDPAQIVVVSITATAASIGAAGIPEAGLVTMIIVLTAVGLPSKDISLILAIDWFLDRCRTSINVLGDSIGAGIVAKLNAKYLKEHDADGEKLVENDEEMEEVKTTGNDRVNKTNEMDGVDNPGFWK